MKRVKQGVFACGYRRTFVVWLATLAILDSSMSFAGDDYDIESATHERDVALLELNRQKNALASSRSELNAASSAESDTRRRISEAESEIRRLEARIAEIKAEISLISRQVPILQSEIQNDQLEAQRLRQQARSIELNRVDVLERELTSDIRPRIVRLRSDIQEAERDQTDQTELNRLKRELVALQGQETRIREDIESKKQQVVSLRAESQALKKRAVEKRQQAAAHRTEASRIWGERNKIFNEQREPLRLEIVNQIDPRQAEITARIEVIKDDPTKKAELKALRDERVKLQAREKEIRAEIVRLDRDEIKPRAERVQALKLQSEVLLNEAEIDTNQAVVFESKAESENQQLVVLQDRLKLEIIPKKQNLQASISSLQIRVDAHERKIDGLKRDLADLQRQEQRLVDDISRIRNQEIVPLRQRAEELDRQVERKQQQVRDYQIRSSDLQAELRRLESDLVSSRDYKRRLELSLPDLQARVRAAQSQVQSAEVRVADAQGVYNVKLARYNEVKRNREIAEQRARTLGSEEGKIAGAKEAELTAAQTGLRMGDQEGKVDGQLKGEGESRLISYSVGFNASLLSPELAPLSYQDGQLKGRKAVDHHASISAYPAEVNRVLDEISTRQPTATVEINMTDDLETVEVDAGLFDAEKKSVASVQKPRKPNAVDEPLYQDPLVKVPTIVVPQPTLGEPVSCQNAHPLFVGSCVTAYRLSHAAEFQDRYRALYAPAYAKAYGESSKDAYGQARSKLVESEKLRGMTDSSLQVGFVDGYLKFEEESISSAIMKARGDVEARLESTSLLRLVSLMIEDANQDGVLSPGETLSFSAVIDNIGGKASKTHSLKMQFVQSVGIQAVESSVELPSLAGDTRTLVHGLLPSVIKVGDRAKIEASMELKYVDSQGQVKVLGSLGVTAEVSLPVSVTQMEIGTIAQVGEEGTLLFTVSNKTKKDFIGASLRVLMNAEIGTPKAETQKLDLAAGTSTKITVPYLVGLGAGGNQSFPVRMSLGDLQGLLPVEQIYDVIVPARRNASLYACLPDCKVNYRMPVRVEAGTEFKIPIILKAHSDSAAKFEYEIRRTESSSPAIMPGDGSFLSTIVSNPRVSSIENRYEIKLRFPLSLKGQAHWMSVVVKEGNKTIHRLFVPFLVE